MFLILQYSTKSQIYIFKGFYIKMIIRMYFKRKKLKIVRFITNKRLHSSNARIINQTPKY